MRIFIVTMIVVLMIVGAYIGSNPHKIQLYWREHFEETFFIDNYMEVDPNKDYTITWWAYNLLPPAGEDFEEQIQQTIAFFTEQHPNINVEYLLLDILEGEETLQKALASGNPPDLYLSLFEPYVYLSELQVPVDLYLSKEQSLNYQPLALTNFTHDESLWAWPLWLTPDFCVHNMTLGELPSRGLDVFLQAAIAGSYNLVCSDLFTLLEAYFEPNYILELGQFGDVEWMRLMDAVWQAQKQGLVLSASTDSLEVFLEGRARIIGPVNQWLLSFIRSRGNHQIYWLETANVDAMGLMLFRQEAYKGHDHLQAVATFARYLVEKALPPGAKGLLSWPAYMGHEASWLVEHELDEEELAQYNKLLAEGRPARLPTVEDWERREAFLERIAAPLWGHFMNGELTSHELWERLYVEAHQILHEHNMK